MEMASRFCVLAAIFAVGSAIERTSLPETCLPMIPERCPSNEIEECTTCCCESTDNIEFYDPDEAEPECTAPPATYKVAFMGTWSEECQPSYYVENAHWSPPTAAAHNLDYRMWDACMDNVTDGVAIVSQTGNTMQIRMEYAMAGDSILNTSQGVVIDGVGKTSVTLLVNSSYQWVSVISMLAPSMDRMVGVADLRLCSGSEWRKFVRVCTELFSTATNSERVSEPMSRNSVQNDNCSFGFFEFTQVESEEVDSSAGIAGALNLLAVMLFTTAAIFQFF